MIGVFLRRRPPVAPSTLIGKSVISLHTVSGSNRSIISDVWEFFKGYPVVNKILPMKFCEKLEMSRTRNAYFPEFFGNRTNFPWSFN